MGNLLEAPQSVVPPRKYRLWWALRDGAPYRPEQGGPAYRTVYLHWYQKKNDRDMGAILFGMTPVSGDNPIVRRVYRTRRALWEAWNRDKGSPMRVVVERKEEAFEDAQRGLLGVPALDDSADL